MTVNELREKSLKIAHEARAMLNDITSENKAEKEAEFDRAIAESDDLAARAKKLEMIEAREREFNSISTTVPGSRKTVEGRATAEDVEARDRAIADYLAGAIDVREVRAAGVATPAGGGILVPTDLASKVIVGMKAYGPMNEGGPVTYLVTAGGNPLVMPTLDDTANMGFIVAEGAEVPDRDIAFGSKTLGAYKFSSGLFKISSELLADSTLPVQDIFAQSMSQRHGRILNNKLTIGTGVNEPEGLITAAAVGKTAASATALAADELLDLQHSLDPAYRGKAAYMFNDGTFNVLRKLKDAQGRYIWQPALSAEVPATIHGSTFHINTDMAGIATGARSVAYGDYSAYTVRRVNEFAVRRLDERFATSDQIAFVAFGRYDGKLLDTRAVKVLVQA